MRISDWSSDVCSSDLAEIEGKPARQVLQTQHAEEAANAGLELENLALAGIQLQIAIQVGWAEFMRTARPLELAGQIGLAALDHVLITKSFTGLAQVADIPGQGNTGIRAAPPVMP